MVLGCRALGLAVLGLVLLASPAFAQAEPGVTLDPGSPAAKEYALPIEQARRDAGGGERPSEARSPTAAPAATTAPSTATTRFGEGIRPARPAGHAARATSRAKAGAKATPAATVTTKERARAQKNIARALTAASVNRGDSSDGSLVLLVGGSLVMVLGLALGYVLRRRRQA